MLKRRVDRGRRELRAAHSSLRRRTFMVCIWYTTKDKARPLLLMMGADCDRLHAAWRLEHHASSSRASNAHSGLTRSGLSRLPSVPDTRPLPRSLLENPKPTGAIKGRAEVSPSAVRLGERVEKDAANRHGRPDRAGKSERIAED